MESGNARNESAELSFRADAAFRVACRLGAQMQPLLASSPWIRPLATHLTTFCTRFQRRFPPSPATLRTLRAQVVEDNQTRPYLSFVELARMAEQGRRSLEELYLFFAANSIPPRWRSPHSNADMAESFYLFFYCVPRVFRVAFRVSGHADPAASAESVQQEIRDRVRERTEEVFGQIHTLFGDPRYENLTNPIYLERLQLRRRAQEQLVGTESDGFSASGSGSESGSESGPERWSESGSESGSGSGPRWHRWGDLPGSVPGSNGLVRVGDTAASARVRVGRGDFAFDPLEARRVNVLNWLNSPDEEDRADRVLLATGPNPNQFVLVTRSQVRATAEQATCYACPNLDTFRGVNGRRPLYNLRSLGAPGGRVPMEQIKAQVRRVFKQGKRVFLGDPCYSCNCCPWNPGTRRTPCSSCPFGRTR
jgi:hypothetical protein